MNQLSRTAVCALEAFALLLLSNCATHSTATKPPAAQSKSSIASLTNPVSSVASTANPKIAIVQNTGNLLSPEQKMQLSQLNIPIFTPTYLPSGFRLIKFDAGKEEINGGVSSYYSILYQKDNNTCLEISSGVDPAMSLRRLSKTSVKTSLGEVTVYSGNVEGKPLILGQLSSKQGHMLRSGMVVRSAQMKPDGTWTPAEWCNPVSMEEFTQVLRSLEVLKS